MGNNLGQVRHQINSNKEKIEEIQKIELINFREELEVLRNRPMSYTHIPLGENRETINFKEYRENRLEFLERLEELISRNKENQWHMIRNLLDETFKNITDNWWTAIRNDITIIQSLNSIQDQILV